MRDPIAYYQDKIGEFIDPSTTQVELSAQLTEEEIVERNSFIIDFIVNQ